jgi:hypothetical protein
MQHASVCFLFLLATAAESIFPPRARQPGMSCGQLGWNRTLKQSMVPRFRYLFLQVVRIACKDPCQLRPKAERARSIEQPAFLEVYPLDHSCH